MVRKANGGAPGLDRDKIIDQALVLLDEEGLEAITTRRLADRLGVKSPALYWHFKDKGGLLAAMSERLASVILSKWRSGAGWGDDMFALGCLIRKEFLGRRDASRLYLNSAWTDRTAGEFMDVIRKPLLDAGESAERASSVVASVVTFALGWSAIEQKPERQEAMSGFFDIDESFKQGLRALLLGLGATLAGDSGPGYAG